jgi:hypothetical protein
VLSNITKALLLEDSHIAACQRIRERTRSIITNVIVIQPATNVECTIVRCSILAKRTALHDVPLFILMILKRLSNSLSPTIFDGVTMQTGYMYQGELRTHTLYRAQPGLLLEAYDASFMQNGSNCLGSIVPNAAIT